MKYIILLLITFNTYAQYKVEINPSDSKYAKMQIDCADQAECDSKLLDWINKQQFFKGVWNDDATGSVLTETRQNEENENVTQHFHPANFSVELVDMREQIAAEQAAKEEKKAKRQLLKAEDFAKTSNESVSEWRQRVANALEELLKDMKEE